MSGVMAYHNNYLYVAGGVDQSGLTNKADFYRFNVATYEWEDITNTSIYKPTILAGCAIYADYFYYFFGWDSVNSVDSPKIFRAKLEGNFEWEEVASHEALKRDSFSYDLVDSNLYVFGGYSVNSLKNDMVIIDLLSTGLDYTTTVNQNTPVLRVFHSFEAIGESIYLFGGMSLDSNLNDLWSFDISSEKWHSIISLGNIPSARSQHASSSLGDNMIILGRCGEFWYLNDIFKYTASTNSWEEITTESSIRPTPRVSPCMVLMNPYIYVYGGETEIGLSSELWRFEIGSNEYTLLNSNDRDGPGAIQKHKCYIDDSRFYVVFGTGIADAAQGQVHYFDLGSNKWTLLTTSSKKRNGAMVLKIDSKIIIGGGETWGIYLFDQFFYIDLANCSAGYCQEYDMGELNEFFTNGAYVYMQNYIYAHGGSSPLNGIHRSIVPKNSFFKLDLAEICPSCGWHCSLGSELKSGKCTLCPKGFYAERYGEDCVPCEKGFYNDRTGSRSFRECFPCAGGSFNPYIGANYCLDCPAQAICPIGSTTYTYKESTGEEYFYQPDFYTYRTAEANQIALYLIVAVTLVGVFVLSLFLFWKRLNNYLVSLDLFEGLHTHGVGNVVTLQKNKMGGAFGIAFYTVALILVLSTLPAYIMDNLVETKSLVPYIIVQEDYDFFAKIIVRLELDNYKAPCQVSVNSCDSTIQYSTQFLNSKSGFIQRCYQGQDRCVVSIECKECSLESTSLINFEFLDSISYSSGIRLNVTSFSSIPGESSTMSYSIYSPYGTVFRGSPASVFYFSMITSVYKNSIDGDEQTGYHVIMHKNPTLGASHSTVDVPFTSNMLVQIELSRSENSLMTLHDEKNPIILLAITLLGSISGALGAIGAGMASIEKFYERIRNKINQQRNTKEVIESRKKMKVFLSERAVDGESSDLDVTNKTRTAIEPEFLFVKKELDVDEIR